MVKVSGAEAAPVPPADSARAVFLAWERLRIVYNATLAGVVLVLGGSSLGDPAFWRLLTYGAALANLCFCLAPVAEGYLCLLGADRRMIRWVVFVPGTLFACLLAFGAVLRWSLRDID